jgi:hypothetical protein
MSTSTAQQNALGQASFTMQRVDAVARHTRVRALAVTVLEQRDPGVRQTLDVIIRGNWRGESCR